MKFNINDLASFSFNIKDLLKKNENRRMRITIDVLSSLLMLNPPDTIYKFLTQLFDEVKKYDSVVLATLEEGMHPPNVLDCDATIVRWCSRTTTIRRRSASTFLFFELER